MYFVGFCRVCREGLLGIRICGKESSPLVVCDECEALWTDPHCTGPSQSPRSPGSPANEEDLWGPQSYWARGEDIDRFNWRKYTIGHWTSRHP